MRDRHPTIRSHLFALVLAVLLPVIAFTVYLSLLLVQHEQRALEQGAVDRTRAFMSAVDAELRGSITTLQALAASGSLERGRLEAFADEARRALGSQPDWLDLRLRAPDGRILVSARRDVAPTAMTHPGEARRAAETKAPVIGRVQMDGPLGEYAVPILVPVVVRGEVPYVLAGLVRPASFVRLLEQQRLPPTWISGLVDRDERFVARVPTQPVGELASPAFRAAAAKSQEGWYRGLTVEGRDTFTAYYTSAFSGWSIGLAIPTPEVYAAARRASWIVVFGTLGSLALAIGFAYWLGRRIARPLSGLSGAAAALRHGEAKPVRDTGIREVDQVAAALDEAGRAIGERQALLEREKDALQSADRAKDEFLAILGHELRNPLASLTTAAHVLRLAPPGDLRAVQARGVIERQSRQMARLVEELLDISRITMGKATLDRERLDLAQLVAGVAQAFGESGRAGALQVRVDASPVPVDADRSRLEQVVVNLLDNAIKFGPPQSPVTVSVRRDGEDAVLTVADLGEGIRPEAIGRIFDLFVQGPQGPERGRGGLGIGLALVKRVVEMHGGSVAAASEGLGKGAVFSVRLPAAAAQAGPETREGAAVAAGPQRRVLVIEDNEDARRMLGALLALNGHEVREAPDGASGLERAAEEAPDVALIDIGLPDLDGYEVARRLRARHAGRRMRLVAVSGYGQPEDQRRAFEAGFDAHLTKPVGADALRQALASSA